MAEVKFQNKRYDWAPGESLLECLERNGEDIPNACRSGACHSCLVRVTDGPISPIAQLGLKEVWKDQRLCLSCVSTEPADVTVAPSDLSVQVSAEVVGKESLGRDVVRLKLAPRAPFPFRAGQFVNITRPDGLTRSYSVASIESDGVVELHVRVVEGGRMSTWVRDTLSLGHELSMRGPTGDCLYVDGRPDAPLLLMGTGTGLAPLVGIARDALSRKHRGSITLVHGGRAPEDLYLDVELRSMAKKHPNFRYLPTLSQSEPVPGTTSGRVDKVVSDQFKSLTGFRVFLCGSPPMVKDARALAYRLGASLDDIHADAFIAAPPPKPSSKEVKAVKRTGVSLPVLPAAPVKKPFQVKQGTPKLQKLRFGIQAAVFAGFLVQGILFYVAKFKLVGSMLPFMAYDSLGHLVVSSTLVLWATLFAAVFVFGRFACGWLCPIGFVQDLGEKTLKWLKLPVRKPMQQSNTVRFGMAALVLGHFVVMPVLAMPVKLWQFDWLFREPWLLGFPFRAGLFVLDLVLLFVVLGLVLPYFFGPRPYCKLVCETGYLFDLTSRYSFGRIRRNEGFERDTCLSCQRCTNICPQAINVFEEVHLFDRVVNSNCISCMQCVNTCPNDTIVYSLKKKASDTSRVTGYLAALQTRAEDLPRYVLTGGGVLIGAYFGFSVLPPSYFHTYALFASLGGLCGFLLYRGATLALPSQFERWFPAGGLASQVEKERAARIVPLTSEERLSGPARTPQSQKKVIAAAAALMVSAIALLIGVWRHVPSRIGTLDEIPPGIDTAAEREGANVFVLGVPTETSAERTQQTYAGLSDVLKDGFTSDAHIYRAESYGALALAVESGKVDAAFLPGASTYALLKRTKLGVDVLAQAQFHGATTYSGVLVAREGLKQRPLPSKRGLAEIREAGALTEVETNSEAERLFGTRIAFVQVDSLSGYLAPVAWLGQHGVRMTDMGEVIFASTHTRALSLLRSGRVDIAATFDRVLLEAQEEDPTFKPEILARFDGLPNALLVTRPGLPLERREQLLEVLNSVFVDGSQSQTKEALETGAAMDGLVPASVDAVREVGKWLE
ncbi:MAG: PhnD/SsuA/transferrin family substrate-binding protein [Archangium sp.]|nr:PhnD/SsuA/transferrin family substrate-binding protein [Archangium sp.]MDP3572161.1 PhnD/SsuA/transferrin family substrate-binding protein [Archangium sp.]